MSAPPNVPPLLDPHANDCPACLLAPCECGDESGRFNDADQDKVDEAEAWLDDVDSREDRESERYCDERGL